VLKRLFTPRNLAILLLIVAIFVVSGLSVCCVCRRHSSRWRRAGAPHWPDQHHELPPDVLDRDALPDPRLLAGHPSYSIDLDSASSAELAPSGLQNIMEMIVEFVASLSKEIGGHWAPRFFRSWRPSPLRPGLQLVGPVAGSRIHRLAGTPSRLTTQTYVANGHILTNEKTAAAGCRRSPDRGRRRGRD